MCYSSVSNWTSKSRLQCYFSAARQNLRKPMKSVKICQWNTSWSLTFVNNCNKLFFRPSLNKVLSWSSHWFKVVAQEHELKSCSLSASFFNLEPCHIPFLFSMEKSHKHCLGLGPFFLTEKNWDCGCAILCPEWVWGVLPKRFWYHRDVQKK